MSSLLAKIIALPAIVVLCAYLFPNVEYAAWSQAIIVGLIVAAGGLVMEYLLLRDGTAWLSTLADFALAFIVVYFVSNAFDNAAVTFFGALLTAALIGVAEHVLHRWLIRRGLTRKSPA